jgi:hypothetical protein
MNASSSALIEQVRHALDGTGPVTFSLPLRNQPSVTVVIPALNVADQESQLLPYCYAVP